MKSNLLTVDCPYIIELNAMDWIGFQVNLNKLNIQIDKIH